MVSSHLHYPFPVLSTLPDNLGDSRFWTVSRSLQIRVWNLPDNSRKFAISCRLDFPTMKFQIFCVVWIILILTLNVSSQTPVCNIDISNNVIGQMLQFASPLIFKMIGVKECFLHKWHHVPCIMTSSIVLSLSTLNICKCWGLAALPSLSVNNPLSLISLRFCLNISL